MVQQALYLRRSQSNRASLGDACARGEACDGCVRGVCPFAE